MQIQDTPLGSSATWDPIVLIFHHVLPNLDVYTNTPPEVFERQIGWLAHKHAFWTAGDALAAFKSGEDHHNRIILTFDDGYDDNFTYARRILERFQIKASFFILPEYLGKHNTWNKKSRYRAKHLTWDQTNELIKDGHEINSHGLSHDDLTTLVTNKIEDELGRSKEQIRTNLGINPEAFSYPYGRVDDRVISIVKQYYRLGFSTVKSNQSDWSSTLFNIRRIYLPVWASAEEVIGIIDRRIVMSPFVTTSK